MENKINCQLWLVVHALDSSTRETEAVRSLSEFQASLVYMTSLKTARAA